MVGFFSPPICILIDHVFLVSTVEDSSAPLAQYDGQTEGELSGVNRPKMKRTRFNRRHLAKSEPGNRVNGSDGQQDSDMTAVSSGEGQSLNAHAHTSPMVSYSSIMVLHVLTKDSKIVGCRLQVIHRLLPTTLVLIDNVVPVTGVSETELVIVPMLLHLELDLQPRLPPTAVLFLPLPTQLQLPEAAAEVKPPPTQQQDLESRSSVLNGYISSISLSEHPLGAPIGFALFITFPTIGTPYFTTPLI